MKRPPKKLLKLQMIQNEGKNFDLFNTVKLDAFSMPSKFYATTVFYEENENETQTYFTTIDAEGYIGKDKIGAIFKSDEFDSAREAKKWIEEVYEEFLKIIFD